MFANNLSVKQQKMLLKIIKLGRPFYTSEVTEDKSVRGRNSAGGILSTFYRTGIIDKVSGGRDKLWKLGQEDWKQIQADIVSLEPYWI